MPMLSREHCFTACLSQQYACSADKMRRSVPLADEDRWPWLHILANIISSCREQGKPLVMGCSALKESYRDVLRGQHPDSVIFVGPLRCAGLHCTACMPSCKASGTPVGLQAVYKMRGVACADSICFLILSLSVPDTAAALKGGAAEEAASADQNRRALHASISAGFTAGHS